MRRPHSAAATALACLLAALTGSPSAAFGERTARADDAAEGGAPASPEAIVQAAAALLAAETDPRRAEEFEERLGQYPSLVPGEPLLEAMRRRALDAPPALIRAAGEYGGPGATDAVLALIDRAIEERARATRARDPIRVRDVDLAIAACFEALARNGAPRGLARIAAALDAAEETGIPPDRAQAADLFTRCARRALANPATCEEAAATFLGVLASSDAARAAHLLDAIAGLRFPGLLGALGEILGTGGARSPDATVRRAALRALRPFVRGGDLAPRDPGAAAALVAALGDPDPDLRLLAAGEAALSGNLFLAWPLIELYEQDPERSVRMAAHRALVRLAGENHGDGDGWRAWAEEAVSGR